MSDFFSIDDVSIITGILPQSRAQVILERFVKRHGNDYVQFDARGTLKRDRWYDAFVPTVSPENEFIQFIARNQDVEQLTRSFVDISHVHLPGAGAVFSVPCSSFITNSQRFGHGSSEVVATDNDDVSLKKNLSAVYALVQTDRTEATIRAAMQAGSHGPIVYFAEGRGTRDRIGWLKITKKAYEEVILVIVDKVDSEAVKQAMVNAGKINQPGGGMLLEMPINEGLVNLTSYLGARNQLASSHQIVSAIDELMGNTNWRDNRDIFAQQSSPSIAEERTNSLEILCILAPRKHINSIVDAAIEYGAPGANISIAKHFSTEDSDNETGFALHHEYGNARMVMESSARQEIQQKLSDFCLEEGIENTAIYSHVLSDMVRYSSR